MKKTEMESKAMIEYVTPAEKVEIAEVKSALEIVQEEYRISIQEERETKEIMEKISDKIFEAQGDIEKINKEIRKTEGSYKRSSKRETLKKLYNHMVALRETLGDYEEKEDFLQEMFKVAIKNFNEANLKEHSLRKSIYETAKQEGFKYVVEIRTYNGRHEEFTKTMVEAVAQIYMNANIFTGDWEISTIDGQGIVSGYKVLHHTDKFNFEKLIDKYDEKYIDAEFAPVSEKVEYTPASIEEEFNYIEVKAMHNFTFGNYVESIEEMKKFVAKASGDLKKMAVSELKDWIGIARAEGVEVEDFNFEETEDGWEVGRDNAAIYDWTYYHKYPVEGYGAVEIWNAEGTKRYSVYCGYGAYLKSIEFFLDEIAKAGDIVVFAIKADGFRNTHGGEIPLGGGHYDATFSKGTEEENKAAAFAYADYLVEFLSHFEKTENGYALNQEYLREYIYGDTEKTAETIEEPAEKNTSGDFIKEDFYAETEDAARELVKPFNNYYDVKIEVVHFENDLIGFSRNLIARKGEFKSLYLSNRWRHQRTIIYNAKIVGNAEVTKKFTQKQIEGIAKYHGFKLKTPEDLPKTENTYRVEVEIDTTANK